MSKKSKRHIFVTSILSNISEFIIINKRKNNFDPLNDNLLEILKISHLDSFKKHRQNFPQFNDEIQTNYKNFLLNLVFYANPSIYNLEKSLRDI